MDQHATPNFASRFASRFASKRLFATVLAVTFILGFGITASVSFAGFNPELDGAQTLVNTAAAVARTDAGECAGIAGTICKEICLSTPGGTVITTGDFQCVPPGQTIPN